MGNLPCAKGGESMLGLMQRYPLLISSLIVHAARHRGGTEVVSNLGGPTLHRTTYAEVERRSRRLARALGKLGVGLGDRVATLAWNDFRHLELYYGVSGTGAVCHTVNPRLSAEDIAFIMTDAKDSILFADASFATLLTEIAPAVSSCVRAVVLLTDAAGQDRIQVHQFYLTLAKLALARCSFNQRSDRKTHARSLQLPSPALNGTNGP